MIHNLGRNYYFFIKKIVMFSAWIQSEVRKHVPGYLLSNNKEQQTTTDQAESQHLTPVSTRGWLQPGTLLPLRQMWWTRLWLCPWPAATPRAWWPCPRRTIAWRAGGAWSWCLRLGRSLPGCLLLVTQGSGACHKSRATLHRGGLCLVPCCVPTCKRSAQLSGC